MYFFCHDTATTEIYTLSLHDALPICDPAPRLPHLGADAGRPGRHVQGDGPPERLLPALDRKSTRLNSSHANISYAVFCLKKKTTTAERSGANPVPACRTMIHSTASPT